MKTEEPGNRKSLDSTGAWANSYRSVRRMVNGPRATDQNRSSEGAVEVRWRWGLPPFYASFLTPGRGSRIGVVRWTPGAARERAERLRDHWWDRYGHLPPIPEWDAEAFSAEIRRKLGVDE